jgi:septal ring factor EnvC (AmiA/AmiB activator)
MLDFFRTRRSLLATVAEQNRIHDELVMQVAALSQAYDTLHAISEREGERLKEARLRIASLEDENARLKSQIATFAHVRHCYERCEAERRCHQAKLTELRKVLG